MISCLIEESWLKVVAAVATWRGELFLQESNHANQALDVQSNNSNHLSNQGCGSGLIQSGSGSGIFPQSGSTKLLNPDPMRIRIHKGKFEDKFFSKF